MSTLGLPTTVNNVGLRNSRIHHLLNLIALQHLQLDAEPFDTSHVSAGCHTAIDLFFGPWIESDPFFASLEKAERRRNFYWCDPMMRGLLLAALGQQWNDVDRLLSWLDLDLQPEYLGPLEPEVGRFYILVASHFRNPPIHNIDRIVDEINRCHSKRPKLLLHIWQAIQAHSQSNFDQAMLESLSLFAKIKFNPKSADFTEAIAIPESFLNLLAVRLGLRYPSLPDHFDARLITPESIGIR